jgi:hypothetical protein
MGYSHEMDYVYVDSLWRRLVCALYRYTESRSRYRMRPVPSRGWDTRLLTEFGGLVMDVKKLTEEDVWAIMQSDIKLWESATTTAKGNDITKRLILPFGIGEVAIEFQGVDNGIKRRSAAEQWGAGIRARIKEAIDDEAVTARAKSAAAQKEAEQELEAMGEADSGDSDSDQPVDNRGQSSVQASASGSAAKAHAVAGEEDNGPGGTDFVARAEWLRSRINEGEARLKEQRRELKALEAALAVLGGEDE